MNNSDRHILILIFCLVMAGFPDHNILASAHDQLRKRDLNRSILAKGNWIKIGVMKNQVYRLNYDFLRDAGVDPSSIDPRTFKIYGNGCHMLPQENSSNRIPDLAENKIFVQGQEDGHFDPGDYILFYGQSPHKLDLIDTGSVTDIDFQFNIYSDTAFYFLTWGGNAGQRIQIIDIPPGGFPVVDTYDDLVFHETDQENILESGREWYGEKFDVQSSYDFEFKFPGIIASDSGMEIISSVMAQSFEPSSFDVSVNGILAESQEINAVSDATYAVKGSNRTDRFYVSTRDFPSSGDMNLTFRYNRSTGQGVGYLNYFIIRCRRILAYGNGNFVFRSPESRLNPVSVFKIKNAGSNTRVWDITDPLNPDEMSTDLKSGTLQFRSETSTLRTFFVFESDHALPPVSFSKIGNQDLHGVSVPQFLIITNSLFLQEAQKLADLRSTVNGMTTLVVTTNEIFNEFSSGAQDVSGIRDFIKFLYDKGNGQQLKYVLLFGKGSFDYKNRIQDNTDFVPIYESRNSLHPIFSYASDDYFGFMENDEGYWDENNQGDHTIDVAVGRLPVTSMKEAGIIVDKLINYESGKNRFGDWRSKICFVADDGDGVDGIIHEKDADRLATLVDTTYTDYTIKKIYVDAYPQILSPNTQTAPQARQAITDAINDGVLIINFTGHGNESQWTSEDILDLSMVTGFNNRYRLPLFVTATCEFGRHDNPGVVSGAEFALFNDRGGAIGLVTTSRPVFSSTNFILNRAFYNNVFRKVNGKFGTLGEIFKNTKNESLNGPVNRNFSLLADPSMKLAIPENKINISSINHSAVNAEEDTLQALMLTTLSGYISDPAGSELNNYNGSVTVTVLDKPVDQQTLGTQDPVMDFTSRDNILFRGDASVKDGTFSLSFIVPKNINYKNGRGRILMYALNAGTSMDAIGSETRFQVGGTSENFTRDHTPPDIKLFLYDTTYQQGDLTGPNPVLVAELHDESGISTTSYGLDKGIVARLDDMIFYLTDYYKADENDYKNGTVRYQLNNLDKGTHTIELTARDTYNNSASGYLQFTVSNKRSIVLDNLINYPNPFRAETTFSFNQNRAGDDLEVMIEIYSSIGAVVKQMNFNIINSEYKVDHLTWNGTNTAGKKLQSGLYIYRVTVRSLTDGAKIAQNRKLIINY